jgi:hypothetical protein
MPPIVARIAVKENLIYCRICFGMLTDPPQRKKNREFFCLSLAKMTTDFEINSLRRAL